MTTLEVTVTEEAKKRRANRSKYTRPCDACSLRKVKCDLTTPCSKCKAHNIPCTNNRVRKKCGPQNISRKTRDSIEVLSGNQKYLGDNYYSPAITLDKLIPCLQLYQTWFYSVWPVVSVAHLTSKLIEKKNPSNSFPKTIQLNSTNISSYSLSCALAAAIIVQVSFVNSKDSFMVLPKDLSHFDLVREALKSRESCKTSPSPDSLLTSFFLYCYYANLQGGTSSSILYLREAIATAQVLGLHDNNTYLNKSRSETHRLKKIYYLLLVTERFICIEDNVPIILDASIPFPSLDDEEYATLLCGFTELVKVFAIPDKPFFEKIISLHIHNNNPVLNHGDQIQSTSNVSNQTWITAVQQQLKHITVMAEMPDIQKVNILLSKYWMQCLVWNITKKNGLLMDSSSSASNQECLLRSFPVIIARDFLQDVAGFTMFAFELNGPGTSVKMLEIASGLLDSLCLSGFSDDNSFARQHDANLGTKYLKQIFEMASHLKTTVSLPLTQFVKIESFLSSHPTLATFHMPGAGYLSELSEEDSSDKSRSSDEVSPNRDEAQKPNMDISPFSEMNMAYFASPSLLDSRNLSQLNLMATITMDNNQFVEMNQPILDPPNSQP